MTSRPSITGHARRRMAQRGVAEDDVWAALDHRCGKSAGQPGSIWVYGYAGNGRILKVCLTVDEGTVITAAWPDE